MLYRRLHICAVSPGTNGEHAYVFLRYISIDTVDASPPPRVLACATFSRTAGGKILRYVLVTRTTVDVAPCPTVHPTVCHGAGDVATAAYLKTDF